MRRIPAVGRSVADAVVEQVGRAVGRVHEASPLPTDVLEGEDAYLVVVDAPGATASDVQVRYRRDAVEVRIDRFREHREGFEMRFPGRGMALDARAQLPTGAAVDVDAATATLRGDGTLEVRIPKRAGADEGGRVNVEEPDEAEAHATDDS